MTLTDRTERDKAQQAAVNRLLGHLPRAIVAQLKGAFMKAWDAGAEWGQQHPPTDHKIS